MQVPDFCSDESMKGKDFDHEEQKDYFERELS
jgi:hypothetical protein